MCGLLYIALVLKREITATKNGDNPARNGACRHAYTKSPTGLKESL